MSIKLSLIDNDQAVCATTDLASGETEDCLGRFLRELSEDLIPGETAHLAIEGSKLAYMNFEITKVE